MKNLIMSLLCILIFSGCMTQKKQQRIAHAYFSIHVDELAAICASNYPDETKYIKGDVIVKIDTVTDSILVSVDCPDGSIQIVDCPPNKTITIDNSRVDTIEVLSTSVKAQLHDQSNKIRDLQIELAIKKAEAKKAEDISTRRLFTIIALGVLMGLGIFLRIKNKF